MALNILTQVLAPTVSMALTSGPTTPEVASFEPVDTTDMVSFPTGDFTYSVPLLDVPGPEGGYPVSLSYHAGILPNQDASWVGLGWNLNPGCINRTPNNFADDYSNATYTISDNWNGGITTNYSVGVGVGYENIVSVGVNVGVQNDTYKGSYGTVGVQMGLGIQGTDFGVGVGYEYGGGNSSGFVYVGSNSTGLGIQIARGSDGGETYTNISVVSGMTQSSMGVTLSGGGTKFSATPTTMFMASNDNRGAISTSSGGFNVSIPIYCFYVSLGYKYCRYWSSTQASTKLYGVLNSKAGSAAVNSVWPAYGRGIVQNQITYDCSVLKDPNVGYADQTDMNWCSNASLPSYDNYMVTGQGVSGSIEPVVLDNGSLFRSYVQEIDHTKDQYNGIHYQSGSPRMFTKAKHFFRFLNDFSNSHTVDVSNPAQFGYGTTVNNWPGLSSTNLGYTVNNIDTRGYKKTLNANSKVTEARFAGSKHVEFYTNAEILSGTAYAKGFINTPNVPNTDRGDKSFSAAPMVKELDVRNNIGGYTITNEKGVSYHYALPVYTYDYYQKIEKSSAASGITKREIYNPTPYAYTWLLTAVTGPDYVDTDRNGFISAGDWGYWVNFNYGKFQAAAGFRTPETGTTFDIDGSAIYSKGAKEIYYLDAITTRTHTALFIKDSRSDAKGTNAIDYNSFSGAYIAPPVTQGIGVGTHITTTTYTSPATNSLKLSEIILLRNEDTASIFTQYNAAAPNLKGVKAISQVNCNNSLSNCDCYQIHTNDRYPSGHGLTTNTDAYATQSLYQNVLDLKDFTTAFLTQLRNTTSKRVMLNHDYSLCPNTTNSYDSDPSQRKGKLTLNNIKFYGNNSVQLMPSTNFGYNLPDVVTGSITLQSAVSSSPVIWNISTSANFAVGDILTFTSNINVNGSTVAANFYGTLISTSAVGQFQMLFYGPTVPNPGTYVGGWTVANVTQTKNPPYMTDFMDLWGFFKSDYVSGVNYNKSKRTSQVSAKAVDCWSLRSIQTPVGATINMEYESDDYNDVVLKNYSIFNLKKSFSVRKSTSNFSAPFITSTTDTGPFVGLCNALYTFNGTNYNYDNKQTSYDYQFTVANNDLQYPLTDFFKVGDKIKIVAATVYSVWNNPQKQSTSIVEVLSVTNNTILIRDPSFQIFEAATQNFPFNYFNLLGAFIVPSRSNNSVIAGGGVRIKNISVTDGSATKETKYIYGNGSNSFGSTAYEPNSMDELAPLSNPIYLRFTTVNQLPMSITSNEYQNAYYQAYNKIIAYAKDLVAPGVIYRRIDVKNSVSKSGITTSAPVYKSYEFQTFADDMVQTEDLIQSTTNNYYPALNVGWAGNNNVLATTSRMIKITNNASGTGNLLAVKNYDNNNNLLSGIFNTYTSTPPNNQGRVDQVFNECRRLNSNEKHDEQDYAVVTIKSELPSVLQSTTSRDYVKGLSSTTSNTAFDFYSGAVTETQTTDSYGDTYISITEPAYNFYPGMGNKLFNNLNSNMLDQVAASYTVKNNGIPANISCSIQPTGNGSESQVTLVDKRLPMLYHIGSTITLPAKGDGITRNVYITSISEDRWSFKVVGPTDYGNVSALNLKITGTMLSASVNTWSSDWNYRMINNVGSASANYATQRITDNLNTVTVQNECVWRKNASYIWNSPYINADGSYIDDVVTGGYVPFTFKSTPNSPYWIKTNENTLFSIYSKPLENINVNGKYSAIKFCNNESYVLASAANARYTEFTQCGAEYKEPGISGYAEGEVIYGSASQSSLYRHTGSKCFTLAPAATPMKYKLLSSGNGATYKSDFTPGKKYKASVWVFAANLANAQLSVTTTDNSVITTYTANSTNNTAVKCGSWYLLTVTFTSPSTTISSNKIEVGVQNIGTNGNIYFDDFRFQPDVSSVTSYVYDTFNGQLTYVIGNDNRYTRYEYDARNKLKAVYRETTYGELKLSETDYNFARPMN